MMKWEGFGWIIGTILSANDNKTRKINGVYVNFFVLYDMDDEDEPPVPHVLQLDRYKTTEDAAYDSWFLLEKKESEAAMEEEPMSSA